MQKHTLEQLKPDNIFTPKQKRVAVGCGPARMGAWRR